MSGIVYKKSGGGMASLTAPEYTNITPYGTTLYVRTGTGENDKVAYGLTTDTSASAYSPAINVSGKTMYIASGTTVTTGTSYHTATRKSTSGETVRDDLVNEVVSYTLSSKNTTQYLTKNYTSYAASYTQTKTTYNSIGRKTTVTSTLGGKPIMYHPRYYMGGSYDTGGYNYYPAAPYVGVVAIKTLRSSTGSFKWSSLLTSISRGTYSNNKTTESYYVAPSISTQNGYSSTRLSVYTIVGREIISTKYDRAMTYINGYTTYIDYLTRSSKYTSRTEYLTSEINNVYSG